MAEWFMRETVNFLYFGSNPNDAFKLKFKINNFTN